MVPKEDKPDSKSIVSNNIEKIFRYLLLLSFVIVLSYKIIISNFDLSNFNFSDLLSLILGMFSIGLAVMFYIKANETSNNFYDNTYKFTQDVSIILGRIEAGFGEKLKHLDEGYNRINDAIYNSPKNEEEARKEIKSNEIKLEKVLEEREAIIQDLLLKVKLADSEKDKISQTLKQKDTELRLVQIELSRLRSEAETGDFENFSRNNAIEEHFKNVILRDFPQFRDNLSESEFVKIFSNNLLDFNELWLQDCKNNGYISKDGKLTKKGFYNFRAIARKLW